MWWNQRTSLHMGLHGDFVTERAGERRSIPARGDTAIAILCFIFTPSLGKRNRRVWLHGGSAFPSIPAIPMYCGDRLYIARWAAGSREFIALIY